MYQAKFIQLLAVISLTTFITACSDKPKETEQTQPPQEQTSTEIKAEELNIATYDPQAEENSEKVGDDKEDKLAEEINKLDAELEKVAEEIKPSKTTAEVAPTKTTQETEETTQATAEVAETEPSADDEELSELEKEAMAMADDVNEY